MFASALTLSLPEWAVENLNELYMKPFERVEDRMAVVLSFARKNFEHGTGGPFAAGVFERATGRLVTIGVNRVMSSKCSSAHAEIMALSLAQQTLATHTLGANLSMQYQFVVNWRPCSMCFGATIWSGISELVIPSHGPELEEITGFDEGPVVPNWEEELSNRNISLINGVLVEEAVQIFHDFAKSGQFVYNPRNELEEVI